MRAGQADFFYRNLTSIAQVANSTNVLNITTVNIPLAVLFANNDLKVFYEYVPPSLNATQNSPPALQRRTSAPWKSDTYVVNYNRATNMATAPLTLHASLNSYACCYFGFTLTLDLASSTVGCLMSGQIL
ncbi:hypothetical protein HDU89_007610 [Geranomyces variabilis]|nr:hypothetical protein HDU89_007610 [Geranomyces variabilis]